MKRFIATISLVVSLAVAGGVASAQEEGAVINADGSSGAANPVNPAVDADGPTVVYGDLNVGPGTNVIGVPEGTTGSIAPPPGTTGNITATDGNASTLGPGSAEASPGTVTGGAPGTALLGPDGTYSVSDSPPSNVSVGEDGVAVPAPAPVTETTTTETAPAPAETAAVGTEGDADGDNLPDVQEAELGLDPYNVDVDGDGVADGDEVNIYGTDPWVWDTDGDGVGDGDELFNTRTDPLVWESADGAAASGDTGEVAASGEAAATELAVGETSAVDSDSDRLPDVDESALGTDPANPDTDGDGYYDGDEAALGADPFDPGSFPAT